MADPVVFFQICGKRNSDKNISIEPWFTLSLLLREMVMPPGGASLWMEWLKTEMTDFILGVNTSIIMNEKPIPIELNK